MQQLTLFIFIFYPIIDEIVFVRIRFVLSNKTGDCDKYKLHNFLKFDKLPELVESTVVKKIQLSKRIQNQGKTKNKYICVLYM